MNSITSVLTPAGLLGLLLITAPLLNENSPAATTSGKPKAPAFVGRHWQMTAFKLDPVTDFDGDGKADADLLPFMPACDRDNTITFGENGSIAMSEGKIRCEGKAASTPPLTGWRYNAEAHTLVLSDGKNAAHDTTWELVDVSASTLVIKTTATENGKNFDTVIHWKAL